MKTVVKNDVCGVTCFKNAENCNGYCYDNRIPGPSSFTELILEEPDLWNDVINFLAEWPGGEIIPTLMDKYELKERKK